MCPGLKDPSHHIASSVSTSILLKPPQYDVVIVPVSPPNPVTKYCKYSSPKGIVFEFLNSGSLSTTLELPNSFFCFFSNACTAFTTSSNKPGSTASSSFEDLHPTLPPSISLMFFPFHSQSYPVPKSQSISLPSASTAAVNFALICAGDVSPFNWVTTEGSSGNRSTF